MVKWGMHGKGGACMAKEACMAEETCMMGGMCGRVCVGGGMHGREGACTAGGVRGSGVGVAQNYGKINNFT